MAENKPKVVVSSRRRSAVREFKFTAQGVQAFGAGAFADYRQKAWETYQSLALPTTREEAWRRTDLRSLPVGDFRLP
ncbi:MAG: hypothetical protein GXP40_03895, partial [Chloroflexi bacterium]|nr:hypothetical protein [Chloroflexota bacterium]